MSDYILDCPECESYHNMMENKQTETYNIKKKMIHGVKSSIKKDKILASQKTLNRRKIENIKTLWDNHTKKKHM